MRIVSILLAFVLLHEKGVAAAQRSRDALRDGLDTRASRGNVRKTQSTAKNLVTVYECGPDEQPLQQIGRYTVGSALRVCVKHSSSSPRKLTDLKHVELTTQHDDEPMTIVIIEDHEIKSDKTVKECDPMLQLCMVEVILDNEHFNLDSPFLRVKGIAEMVTSAGKPSSPSEFLLDIPFKHEEIPVSADKMRFAIALLFGTMVTTWLLSVMLAKLARSNNRIFSILGDEMIESDDDDEENESHSRSFI